jgi:hypothetical protein
MSTFISGIQIPAGDFVMAKPLSQHHVIRPGTKNSALRHTPTSEASARRGAQFSRGAVNV